MQSDSNPSSRRRGLKPALLAALLCLGACGAASAEETFQDGFHAGLSLRAGFGGPAGSDWSPHLLASFGSSALLWQPGRSAEAQCVMIAGDLRNSAAVNSVSACDARPLVQVDLSGGGLKGANLLGLDLLKAPAVLKQLESHLPGSDLDWLQWTRRHSALNPPAAAPADPGPAASAPR
jgi:hypothetical protein